MKSRVVHLFPLYQEFKKAVEKSHRIANSISFVDEYDGIREAFRSKEAVDSDSESNDLSERSDELGLVGQEATIAHILDSVPLEPYLTLANILRDALRVIDRLPPISAEDGRWIQAIKIAEVYAGKKDVGGFGSPQPKHITFAQSVHFFNSRGICLPMTGTVANLHSRNIAVALAATVTQPLLSAGEARSIKFVNDLLLQKYDPFLRRIRLHPTPDAMGKKMDRSVPCGYLYRAALKSLGRERIAGLSKNAFENITQTAIHFGALFDVEPFSIYEDMFPSMNQQVLQRLAKVAIYDELFGIPQCDPIVMQNLMIELFLPLKIQGGVALDWNISDALQLWSLLLTLSRQDTESTFVKRSELISLLGARVGPYKCHALLRTFLTEKPNKNYFLPSDAGEGDLRECVIAPACNDRLWIPARLFLGPPFYARFLSALWPLAPDIGNQIGRLFEDRMFKRLTALGIRCRRGDIGKKKRLGDADLIIETDNVIALFELKKKGLRRKTNAGNDLHLVIDLAKGLIHGVTQLAKQEFALMREGKLTFANGDEIQLNKRRIVKCVVSLSDYGGLHEGSHVRNVLMSLCGASLTVSKDMTISEKNDLDDTNKILSSLSQRYLDFRKVHSEDEGRQFFDNIIFHNIFFIEHLLQTQRTAADFIDTLLRGSRIITGTRDPFFDQAHFGSPGLHG